MKFFLTLIFACGPPHCMPGQVKIPTPYDTLQQCQTAGKYWTLPNANPTNTIKTTRCVRGDQQ